MMNFSDETVERVKTPEFDKACRMYKPGLGGINDIIRAALSSLTLADLMQVEEVRALVTLSREAANTIEQCIKVEHGWPIVHPANQRRYDRDMEQVQDILKATEAFTEPKQ